MSHAYIAFGSNLGNRVGNVARALTLLSGTRGVQLEKISSLYRTAPVGSVPQPEFLNGVVKIRTAMTSRQLLRCLSRIEKRLGRVRLGPNLPRNVDLDILEHGMRSVSKPDLVLPHPRMRERKFVLQPLSEIAPNRRLSLRSKRLLGQIVVKMEGVSFEVR